MIDARLARQIGLPEVGLTGQERLGAVVVTPPGGAVVAEIVSKYAARAGMRVAQDAALDGTVLTPAWIGELRQGPREVAAGAHVVLFHARRALLLSPGKPGGP